VATYKLVPVELTQVDDGNGTLGGLDVGSLKRDELSSHMQQQPPASAHP
jgi:hypothetical protein